MVTDSNANALTGRNPSLLSSQSLLWQGHRFAWKHPDSWTPRLTSWLEPYFRRDAKKRLKPGQFRDLYLDDPEWSQLLDICVIPELEFLEEQLGEAIRHSILRVYHGCRTSDAGTYFRDGLRVHNRSAMIRQVKAIADSDPSLKWIVPKIDQRIARIDNKIDIGRLFVVVDDVSLLDGSAHYLIYGSEWITAVLGEAGRDALLKSGAPTLLDIDLPLSMTGEIPRKHLASRMLREWTRYTCNGYGRHAPIDFTFTLRSDIRPEYVVGHSHPVELPNPLELHRLYRSPIVVCRYCEAEVKTSAGADA